MIIETIGSIALGLGIDLAKSNVISFTGDNRTTIERDLDDVIQSTIESFEKENPISETYNKIPFYKSAALIDELLRFRIFDDFDQNKIGEKLKNNENIIPPKTAELSLFFSIFDSLLEKKNSLKEIEIKRLQFDEINQISKKVDSALDLLQNLLNGLGDGLAKLNEEYLAQLDDIEKQIFGFMPERAFQRIVDLENRIQRSNSVDSPTMSKLQYLKGLCKLDLEHDRMGVAQTFVNAFKLHDDTGIVRDRACIEYLNLGESEKAINLSGRILDKEEFNHTAWLVRILSSHDFLKELELVPKSVRSSDGFNISLGHNLISAGKVKSIANLEDLGISLNLNFKGSEVFNYKNKEYWFLKSALLLQWVFEEFPTLNFFNKKSIYERTTRKSDLLFCFTRIFDGLVKTEAYEYSQRQIFYYYFVQYMTGNDKENLEKIHKAYIKLKAQPIFVTLIIQALIKNQEFSRALQILEVYEGNAESVKTSEIYLYETLISSFNKDYIKSGNAYKKYLESLNVIEESNLVNVLNLFGVSLLEDDKNYIDDLKISKELDSMFEICTISSPFIRVMLETSIEARFSANPDKAKLAKSWLELSISNNFMDVNAKMQLAVNYHSIGKYDEAIAYMDTFVEKNSICPELGFYISCLHDRLESKEHKESSSSEILKLLKFWRISSTDLNKRFLSMEFNLVSRIGNFERLGQISTILYEDSPNDENVLMIHGLSLLQNNDINGLKKLSEVISDRFVIEKFGLKMSAIFREGQIENEVSFNILRNLAENPDNKVSRTNFIGAGALYPEKFIHFDKVKLGCWVKYRIESRDIVKEIKNENGSIESILLNKNKGDKVQYHKSITDVLSEIEILDIFNYNVKITIDILEEAKDPTSGLGLEMFKFDSSNIESFEKQLIEISGHRGLITKKLRDDELSQYYLYQKSFTELCTSVFDDNPIDAYYYLVFSPNNFVCIPTFAITPDTLVPVSKYVLDFASVIFFSELEENLDCKFDTKFVISPLVSAEMRRRIIEAEMKKGERLSVDVVGDSVKRYYYSEDQVKSRIDNLKRIEEWINTNCIVEYPEEKLDLILKLEQSSDSLSFNLFVDNLIFLQREGYLLISNDMFYYKISNGNRNYVINTESYLIEQISLTDLNGLYRFMLKRRFVGLNIPAQLIFEEFLNYIKDKDNVYKNCFPSLRHSMNPNPKKFEIVSDFLKQMYLMPTITTETKNFYAQEILLNLLHGTNARIFNSYGKSLAIKFELLGELRDEVINIMDMVGRILFRK